MTPKKLQELLDKVQGELTLLIILTGVTARHGLGFNRVALA